MLITRLQPLHAHGAPLCLQDLRDMCASHHAQVFTAHGRAQKRGGCVTAPVPAQGELVAAHAIGLGAIKVIGAGMASLCSGIEPGLAIGVVVA